jgi:hypothetical protein
MGSVATSLGASVGGRGWPDALARFLGGGREIQYRRTTMGVNRRPHLTTALVVLAVLLGSLWAGGLAGPAAGGPAGQLAAGASLPGIEPAALPDRAPALRPVAERPGPDGRLLPLLLGLLAASLAVTYGVGARRRRSSLAPARSLLLSAPRGPRAPPRLQPA